MWHQIVISREPIAVWWDLRRILREDTAFWSVGFVGCQFEIANDRDRRSFQVRSSVIGENQTLLILDHQFSANGADDGQP